MMFYIVMVSACWISAFILSWSICSRKYNTSTNEEQCNEDKYDTEIKISPYLQEALNNLGFSIQTKKELTYDHRALRCEYYINGNKKTKQFYNIEELIYLCTKEIKRQTDELTKYKESNDPKIKMQKMRNDLLISKLEFFKQTGGPKTKGDWIIYDEIKKFINLQ